MLQCSTWELSSCWVKLSLFYSGSPMRKLGDLMMQFSSVSWKRFISWFINDNSKEVVFKNFGYIWILTAEIDKKKLHSIISNHFFSSHLTGKTLVLSKNKAGKNRCPCERDKRQIYVWLYMFCRWRLAWFGNMSLYIIIYLLCPFKMSSYTHKYIYTSL